MVLQHRLLAAQLFWSSFRRALASHTLSSAQYHPTAAAALASMAAADGSSEDNIFELLKKADPKELETRQEAITKKLYRTHQLGQQRLAELIDQNSTLPTTVSSVTVLGAPNTRHGFLKHVVNPLLSANRDRPYTQAELVHEVAKTADKLKKFGTSHSRAGRIWNLLVCRNLPRTRVRLPR